MTEPVRLAKRLAAQVPCSRREAELYITGGWVDYATVFYWYQNNPGGFTHDPLPPCAERRKVMLHPSTPTAKEVGQAPRA